MTPTWLTDIFAALMLVIAAMSAARLAAARPWQRGALVADTDIAHLLMAIAMAGMLSASLTTLQDTAWEGIFGLMTAWFAYRVGRDYRVNGTRALAGGHRAPHLVHSAAMLYMFLAVTVVSGAAGMNGMTGSSAAPPMLSYPTLAVVFGLILIGYTIWDLDQLSMAARDSRALAMAGVPALAAATDESPPGAAAGVGRLPTVGVLLAPGTTVASRIAMGATMALMLFLMVCSSSRGS